MKNIGVRFGLASAALGLAGVAVFSAVRAAPPSASVQVAQNHEQWLLENLTKAEGIREGMTRKDVSALFVASPTPDVAGSQRPFALRNCRLIKVNISMLPARYKDKKYWHFQQQSLLWKGHVPQSTDIVTGVSTPYLAR